MSISACPRCAQHVTLPMGVDNHVQVRCPLCGAQYALADALANAPPTLEVITESLSVPEEWLATPREPLEQAARDDGARLSSLESESNVEPTFALVEDESEEPVEPALAPIDAGHDDITGQDDILKQEQDTELEEAEFTPFEPQFESPPRETESVSDAATAPADETKEEVLDFGQPAPLVPSDDEPATAAATKDEYELDFSDTLRQQPTETELDATIEFGEPIDSPRENVGATAVEFGEPLETGEASEETVLGFGKPEELKPHADEEDFVPDFGEPLSEQATPRKAEAKPVELPGEKATVKATVKAEKKKAGKSKAPAAAAGKRSSLATIFNIAVPSVIAVPLALYFAMWIHPAYDFFNLGPKLPRWMVPAAVHKPIAKAPAGSGQLTISPEMVAAAIAANRQRATSNIGSGGDSPPPAAPAETQDQPAASAEQPRATEQSPPSSEPPSTTLADDTAKSDDAPAAAEVQDAPKPAVVGQPNADSTEPAAEPPAEAALAAKPSADDGSAMPEEAAADKGGPDKAPSETAGADKAAPDKAESVSGDDSLSDLLGESKPGDEAVEEPGPLDPPVFSPGDLTKAIHEAVAANQKMVAAQKANQESALKAARKEFYLDLYAVANIATFVKDDGGDSDQSDKTRKTIEQFTRSLAADPKRLEALKGNAARWLAFVGRTTPGIVLAGEVQEAKPVGKLYRVTILAAPGPQGTMTVLSGKDPQVEPGDEVLTIGSIIDHPAVQIPAYDGADSAVVWNGMTMKLRDEAK